MRIRLSDARLEDEGGYFCQLYTEDTHHQIATLTVLGTGLFQPPAQNPILIHSLLLTCPETYAPWMFLTSWTSGSTRPLVSAYESCPPVGPWLPLVPRIQQPE